MGGALGCENRRRDEDSARHPGRQSAQPEGSRKEKDGESGQRHDGQQHQIEGADDTEGVNERGSEQPHEGRVVVQAEIRSPGVRKHMVRRERQTAVAQDLVPEDPQIPDIHAEVAGRAAGKVGSKVQRQRPHQHAGERHVG